MLRQLTGTYNPKKIVRVFLKLILKQNYFRLLKVCIAIYTSKEMETLFKNPVYAPAKFT